MLSKPLLFTLTRKWEHYCRRHYALNGFNHNLLHVNFKLSYLNKIGIINQNKCLGSDSKKKNDNTFTRSVSKELKTIIKQKKEQFEEKERIFKERKTSFLQDFEETKKKVKGKVEEIVERENVYTIPNFLCIARIALSPYLGYLIVQSQFNGALAVLGFAAITDLLDGWIARTWKSQSSKMGSFLDPMADKILVGTLFLTLTYVDLIPLVLTVLIILRDVILVASGFIIRYLSLPPPRTLSRYFDVTHATVQLAPTFISKVNTAVQLVLVGSTLAAPVFNYVGHPVLESLWYVTAATTVASALSYILSKNTYKMLKKSDKPQDKQ